MVDTIYQHWVGTAYVREKELGNSHQETPVDMWIPAQAPAGTASLGKEEIANELEVFHKAINFKTRVGGLFTLSIGADIFFKGTIEYFK